MSDVKSKITAIYAQLKAKNPSIEIRDQQINLSEDIANSLEAGNPALIGEAPTGTGKTIGYLIGALAVQDKLKLPIVVATATVNLQDQIVNNDIPKLIEIGLINEKEVMRAKGRGRYYCALSGEKLLDKLENMAEQGDFFHSTQEKKPLRKIDQKEAIRIHTEYMTQKWDGEVDSLAKKPYFWDKVQATSDSCLGKGCQHYNACEFFKKRKALSFAKIIIANQDLVLSDLMQAHEDREPIFGFDQYLLIVDECHHLPKKALNTAAKKVNLEEALTLIKQIPLLTQKIFMKPELTKMLNGKNIDKDYIVSDDLKEDCSVFLEWISKTYCAPIKEPFGHRAILAKDYFKTERSCIMLKQKTRAIANSALLTQSRLEQIIDALKNFKKLSEVKDGVNILYECILVNSFVKQLTELCTNFNASDINYARWIEKKTITNRETQEQTVEYIINLAPVEAKEFFRKVLWSSNRAKIAMVSATVASGKRFKDKSHITSKMVVKTILNHDDPTYVCRDFTPFMSKISAPVESKVRVYPSVFPYHKSTLEVPAMACTPKDSDYTKEVIVKIQEAITKHNKLGILILFTSKSMMRQVYAELHEKHHVLSQELESDVELIRKHKEFIDKGERSILLGVQKFSEGLDLPGKYCEHLMIARLPFAVPTDPIEEEIKQLDSKGYFDNHAIPETAIKFIQMCGRLIRRSEDVGIITVFDKRLTTTRWGLLLLDSIPDYTKDIENNEST